ncbi:MAG TPA: TatD family hydrolase [Chloroflexota bacterium]|nr:TatD family hydrolase [Chloroflexota bacterium]
MPLVDTHAHLTDRRFAADLEAVIARARQAGVGAIVVPAYDLQSSRRAVQLAERYPCLWATVGIHPHDAREATPEALAELETLAAHPRVVAIGECGLDFYRDLSPRPVQREAFVAQLTLAARVDLPVVVHSREAMAPTLDLLATRLPPAGGVMHCFDGTVEEARRAAGLGLFLSCAGPLTYRREPALAEAVASVPLERLVVETDCPYLSPQGHRGERNEPAYVRLVAEALARVRAMNIQQLATQTTENAALLFRTPALAAPLTEAAR